MKTERIEGEREHNGGAIHLAFPDLGLFRDLLGQHDEHMKILQRSLGVRIHLRGSEMEIVGDRLGAVAEPG